MPRLEPTLVSKSQSLYFGARRSRKSAPGNAGDTVSQGASADDARPSRRQFEAKPNRAVIGFMEMLAGISLKWAGIRVIIPPEEVEKLDRVYRQGGSLIVAPTHHIMWDGPVQCTLEKKTGHRNLRLGAREVWFIREFKLPFSRRKRETAFPSIIMRRTNMIDVDREAAKGSTIRRGAEQLVRGEILTLFPPGYLTRKTQEVEFHDYKLGAARMAIQAIQSFSRLEDAPAIYIAPNPLIYILTGEPEAIRTCLEKEVAKLEALAGIEPPDQTSPPSLQTRLKSLFARMVQNEERKFLAQYPALKVDSEEPDPYQRLSNLCEQVMAHLEQQYMGSVQIERAGDKTEHPVEYRARKLKFHISSQIRQEKSAGRNQPQNVAEKLKKVLSGKKDIPAEQEARIRDQETLETLISLSVYKKGYLNDDVARQAEMTDLLARNVRGKYYSIWEQRSFFQTAKPVASMRVGNPIHVNPALAEALEKGGPFDEIALALDITAKMAWEHQQCLDKVFSTQADNNP